MLRDQGFRSDCFSVGDLPDDFDDLTRDEINLQYGARLCYMDMGRRVIEGVDPNLKP